jgi:bifunctional N-acetylglucosamine-1-phosphate-uridyltransferase/glucosamine-1-phosphate-acetyltransferase GlmU-like protein
MADWVKMAFENAPTEVELTEKTTVLQIAKAYAKKTYTAVFFSDTPLLSKKVFGACLNYVKTRGLNVACFDRGYIFTTSALQTLKSLPSIPLSSFAKLQEFFVVDDVNKLMLAEKMLRKRILDYHIKNGVHFLDESTCIIEADVVIGQNVEIWGGNVLRGKTKIGNDTVLLPNNYIEDSSIGNKCRLLNSCVRASKIKENSELPPLTCVDKGIINKR